jgi:hypothetical protein
MDFKFKKFFSAEQVPKKDPLNGSNQELSQELDKKKKILERFRDASFLKRITFLILLLASAEAFGQDKGKYEASVESAKKAVIELDAFVKNNPDKRGKINILGFGNSEFAEKKIGAKLIHSNDYYLYIKDEKVGKDGSLRTEYGVDIGKDGEVDQVVIVPGGGG